MAATLLAGCHEANRLTPVSQRKSLFLVGAKDDLLKSATQVMNEDNMCEHPIRAPGGIFKASQAVAFFG